MHRPAILLAALVDGTVGQRQAVCRKNDAEYTRGIELRCRELDGLTTPRHEVDKQFCKNEADGSEHANHREMRHGVEFILVQHIERHRVAESNRRHEECHRDCVGCEQRAELKSAVGGKLRVGYRSCNDHHDAGQELTQRQCALGRYPAVGHYAHQCGHYDGHESLYGIKPEYVCAETVIAQKHTHRNQVCAPYGELQEVHHRQAGLDFCCICHLFYNLQLLSFSIIPTIS